MFSALGQTFTGFARGSLRPTSPCGRMPQGSFSPVTKMRDETMSGDNDELDFLKDLRRPRKPARFAVLRFALMVEYHPSEEKALARITKLEKYERVALVDRGTGITRCLQQHLSFVQQRLRRDGTAPTSFMRAGALGSLKRLQRKK